MNTYRKIAEINDFNEIDETHTPQGFLCNKSAEHIVFFNLVRGEITELSTVLESIKVDKSLHVQLQHNGNPLPLPSRA